MNDPRGGRCALGKRISVLSQVPCRASGGHSGPRDFSFLRGCPLISNSAHCARR